jgi:flagellum-specific ATP synthase
MRNHYPAIDVLASISRLMNEIVDSEHMEMANKIRNIMSVYYSNYDLINIGAYKSGTNKEMDQAISMIDSINSLLTQGIDESYSYQQTIGLMRQLLSQGKAE